MPGLRLAEVLANASDVLHFNRGLLCKQTGCSGMNQGGFCMWLSFCLFSLKVVLFRMLYPEVAWFVFCYSLLWALADRQHLAKLKHDDAHFKCGIPAPSLVVNQWVSQYENSGIKPNALVLFSYQSSEACITIFGSAVWSKCLPLCVCVNASLKLFIYLFIYLFVCLFG